MPRPVRQRGAQLGEAGRVELGADRQRRLDPLGKRIRPGHAQQVRAVDVEHVERERHGGDALRLGHELVGQQRRRDDVEHVDRLQRHGTLATEATRGQRMLDARSRRRRRIRRGGPVLRSRSVQARAIGEVAVERGARNAGGRGDVGDRGQWRQVEQPAARGDDPLPCALLIRALSHAHTTLVPRVSYHMGLHVAQLCAISVLGRLPRRGAGHAEPVMPTGEDDRRPGIDPDTGPRADYSPERRRRRPRVCSRRSSARLKEFSEDNMTDWAAALTYYGVLSIFPALIAMVSLVGLVRRSGRRRPRRSPTSSRQLGPKSAADTFAGPIESVTSNRGRVRDPADRRPRAARSGRRRATSARSRARPTSSGRRRRAGRSGSSSRFSCS